MVSQSLLKQVSELDRADQMQLVDFIHAQTDDGAVDNDTRIILSERMNDTRANPEDEANSSEAKDALRHEWQDAIASYSVGLLPGTHPGRRATTAILTRTSR